MEKVSELSHAIAATTYNYPTDWMHREISVPHLVYFAGGDNETHKHENVGWESTGYLTYIAEYYNCLPEVIWRQALILGCTGLLV